MPSAGGEGTKLNKNVIAAQFAHRCGVAWQTIALALGLKKRKVPVGTDRAPHRHRHCDSRKSGAVAWMVVTTINAMLSSPKVR